MVSIRKRRHLGLLERYRVINQMSTSMSAQQPHVMEPKLKAESPHFQKDVKEELEDETDVNPGLETHFGSSMFSGNSSSKDLRGTSQDGELKRRKWQRRRQFQNQEACMLRGVYFKNMKWQAAIKVDKKQIHLGTVASMEEAAHLYDRAAYKCGREPNFDLSEEEKQELQGIEWEDFLAMTRSAIASKKRQKKTADPSPARNPVASFGGSSPSS